MCAGGTCVAVGVFTPGVLSEETEEEAAGGFDGGDSMK